MILVKFKVIFCFLFISQNSWISSNCVANWIRQGLDRYSVDSMNDDGGGAKEEEESLNEKIQTNT